MLKQMFSIGIWSLSPRISNQPGADVVRWYLREVIRACEKMELSSAQRSKILLYL